MLKNYYDIDVSRMVVVSFHPDLNEKYFLAEVPILEKEIEAIIDVYR